MLYLVTGTPGAGKTLNSIKTIREGEQFKGRDVYYFGIRDLNDEFGWSELSEEEALKWYELPSNAVIVFDEAYNIFPTSHAAKAPPEHIKRLATHRHQGYDIFLICQKVTGQVHSFVRGLVGTHYHFARIFNSNTINRFEWTHCQENPNSAAQRKNANVKTMRFDSTYFNAYHSADAHTHKMSLPWGKIGLTSACIVLAVVLFVVLYQRLSGRMDSDEPIASKEAINNGIPTRNTPSETRLSFAELYTPEIQGLPWSAPVYREMLKPKSWPRPAACIRFETELCTCYTQQATRLDVSIEFCNSVVDNGYFDATLADSSRERRSADNGGAPRHQLSSIDVPDSSTSANQNRAILIPHTAKPRMKSSINSDGKNSTGSNAVSGDIVPFNRNPAGN